MQIKFIILDAVLIKNLVLNIQVIKLLDMWKARRGKNATMENMLKALSKMEECTAIVDRIKEEYYSEGKKD